MRIPQVGPERHIWREGHQRESSGRLPILVSSPPTAMAVMALKCIEMLSGSSQK